MRTQTPFVAAFSALFITFAGAASAQQQTEEKPEKITDTAADKHAEFKVSLSYLSNSVTYGRRDSATAPYITPAVRYSFKNGLYVEGSLSYLVARKQRGIDLGTIGIGYKYKSADENLNAEAFANKFFTNSAAYSVKSALKGDAGINADYDLGFVSVNTEAYALFSAHTDIAVAVGLFQDISIGGDKSFTISPAANMYAGTENFYEDYFSNKKFSKKRRRVAVTAPTITPIVLKHGFGILDYEFSAPVEYETNTIGVLFTPTYAIPVNPISYSLNNGLTYQAEHLTNTFYAEIGVYLKFGSLHPQK